jgi:putative transposase
MERTVLYAPLRRRDATTSEYNIMSDYRRWYVPGGTYFFTLVTYERHPLFESPMARSILGEVMRDLRDEMRFETIAIVLLPDHLHTIWTLPPGDDNYSIRWKKLKGNFTRRWLKAGGREMPLTASRKRRGERGIWQRRFWEHTELDEDELHAHLDYIHYNPVKHGYVQHPWDWEYSSFRRYVGLGQYDDDWGATEPAHLGHMDLE